MTSIYDRPSWTLMRRAVLDIAWAEHGLLVVGVGLFVVGIGLLVMGVGLFLGMPAFSQTSTGISEPIPAWPAPPVVIPTNVVLPLEAAPMKFTTALPLEEEPSSPPGRTPGGQSNADPDAGAPPERGRPLLAETPGLVPEPLAETEADDEKEVPHVVNPDTSTRSSTSGTVATTYEDQVRQYQKLERKTGFDAAMRLRGFVVDETITRLGRDFYNRFFDLWRAPPIEGFYTIRIQEDPAPGRGTKVQVLVNADPVFQGRLQPGPDGVRDKPLQAARRAYAYVQSGRGILTIY